MRSKEVKNVHMLEHWICKCQLTCKSMLFIRLSEAITNQILTTSSKIEKEKKTNTHTFNPVQKCLIVLEWKCFCVCVCMTWKPYDNFSVNEKMNIDDGLCSHDSWLLTPSPGRILMVLACIWSQIEKLLDKLFFI